MSRSVHPGIPVGSASEAVAPHLSAFWAIIETTKPRITRLVTVTSAVGFILAALLQRWELTQLGLAALGCLAGTALCAAGANALNQLMERDRDARMARTATRPLPQGRISPIAVLCAGLGMCIVGVLWLWGSTGVAPAIVALATILLYLLVYTPLKPVTPLATIVGAVPGALPPLIGWTAGGGSLADPVGWSLFLILFVWQIPHFLAIAWMYREDYAAGGYRVLPVMDPVGAGTAWSMLAWALLLVPVSLAPALLGHGGPGAMYGVIAGLAGCIYVYLSLRLAVRRTCAEARRAFIASVIHLPILMAALVLDCGLAAFL